MFWNQFWPKFVEFYEIYKKNPNPFLKFREKNRSFSLIKLQLPKKVAQKCHKNEYFEGSYSFKKSDPPNHTVLVPPPLGAKPEYSADETCSYRPKCLTFNMTLPIFRLSQWSFYCKISINFLIPAQESKYSEISRDILQNIANFWSNAVSTIFRSLVLCNSIV